MKIKQPVRSIRMALIYWYPQKLTGYWIKPGIWAWFWWNFEL